jgi:hypothetical protein
MWLEYNQIWLNLLRHDGQFFYIFLLMIATQATEKKNAQRKTLMGRGQIANPLIILPEGHHRIVSNKTQ